KQRETIFLLKGGIGTFKVLVTPQQRRPRRRLSRFHDSNRTSQVGKGLSIELRYHQPDTSRRASRLFRPPEAGCNFLSEDGTKMPTRFKNARTGVGRQRMQRRSTRPFFQPLLE